MAVQPDPNWRLMLQSRLTTAAVVLGLWVLGIEARGFIFGPALAYRLNAGFVPLRKPGKLPGETARLDYDLEYGKAALEIHRDAIQKGQRVIIVDDLTRGGTARLDGRAVKVVGRTPMIEPGTPAPSTA